jgi:DNA-binding MarR family transcriptional regulator
VNTLTPLLKRLEHFGFIKRTRDLADERLVRVRLTESGLTLRAKAQHIPGCILAAAGLDARTAKQLMTGLPRFDVRWKITIRNDRDFVEAFDAHSAGSDLSNHATSLDLNRSDFDPRPVIPSCAASTVIASRTFHNLSLRDWPKSRNVTATGTQTDKDSRESLSVANWIGLQKLSRDCTSSTTHR